VLIILSFRSDDSSLEYAACRKLNKQVQEKYLSGHHHGHDHHHGHHHSHGNTHNRAFGIGIALNVVFVAVEAYFGWRADSLALLADAGHNLSDVLGLVLAWLGMWFARMPPDDRYTYGRQRASILAALVNALVLLAVMGGMAWEAIQRFHHPLPIQGEIVIAVAAAGVVINGITAWLFMAGSHGDLNIRGAFLHMAGDALVSLGVVVAGALYLWKGWLWLDPLLSLVIAVLILYATWGLFRQSLRLTFDGVPSSIELGSVRTYLRELPGVTDIHDLHVWAMSTSESALTVHLVMPGGHPGDDFLHELGHELHDRYDIDHATVQIEAGDTDKRCRLETHISN
jgi:cobalt-zinc-cadmium efflux system protein